MVRLTIPTAGGFNALACLVLACLAIVSPRPAMALEPVAGQSAALGIDFTTEGEDWCGDTVNIKLSAKDVAVFSGDRRALHQTLGRIRAVILRDEICPKATAIVFDGSKGEKAVYRAEMSVLTRWVAVERDVETGRPLCLVPGVEEGLCARAGHVFDFARRLFDEPIENQPATLTSFLDGRASANVGFTLGTAKGTIVLRDAEAGEAPAARLARELDEAAGAACRSQGGEPEALTIEAAQSAVARLGTQAGLTAHRCRSGSSETREAILAVQEGAAVFALSLEGDAAGTDAFDAALATLAERLAADKPEQTSGRQTRPSQVNAVLPATP
ncbi:MAG: hypothetical protein ACK50Q_09105 [Labrys sp. (in: a-proteobacteria)]